MINAAASGRRVPGSAPGRGKRAEREEKDTALRGLLGNKGVSVVGKGNEAGDKKTMGKARGKGKGGSEAAIVSSGADLKL